MQEDMPNDMPEGVFLPIAFVNELLADPNLSPALRAQLLDMLGNGDDEEGEDSDNTDSSPNEDENSPGGNNPDLEAPDFIGTDSDDVFQDGDEAGLILGEAGDDTLLGGGGDDNLYGGDGDDRLEGEGGNDELYGGPGDDVLIGGAGFDVFVGGPGDDVMAGGADDDVYIFSSLSSESVEDDDESEDGDEGEDEDEGSGSGSQFFGALDHEEGHEDEDEESDEVEEPEEDEPDEEDESDDEEESEDEEDSEDEESDEVEAPEEDEPDEEGGSDDEDEFEDEEESEDEDEGDSDGDDDDEEEPNEGSNATTFGDNVIEDTEGHINIVRFDGLTRVDLEAEQQGDDLLIESEHGSVIIRDYFLDPGLFNFEDSLGSFDPLTQTGPDNNPEENPDDEFEPEDPGDTFDTAQVVEGNFQHGGDVGRNGDEADVFSFTAEADGDVSLRVEIFGGAIQANIYNADGSLITGQVSDDDVIELSAPVTAGETYYFELTSASEDGGGYEVSATFEEDLGDSIAEATSVGADVNGSLTARVGGPDDPADYISLTPEADGTIVIEVDGGENDPNVALFNADGVVITEGTQNGFGENRLQADLEGGQTYFVGITPTTEESVTYSIFSNYQVGGSSESAAVVDENTLAT